MTTYAQLQTDFASSIKRTDLAAQIPGFVALFETRAGRRLRVRQMEAAFTGTINASNQIALPADFRAFKTLYDPARPGCTFRPQSFESVTSKARTSGTPTIYSVQGAVATFDGSGSVAGIYFAAIPGLVAAGSNWLSLMAYDAYLFGVLAEAADYSEDPERVSSWAGRSEAVLAEVVSADQRDRFSGPLVSRVR